MWIEDKRTAWEAPARHLNGKLLYTIIMFFPRCSCRSVQSTVVFGRRRPKLLGSTLATLKGHRARNIPQCWWRLCCRLCFDVSWWFFFAPFVLPMRRILLLLFPVHEVYEEFVVASTVWWRYVVLKAGMELKVEAVPCCVKAHAWHKLLDSIG